MASGIYPLPVCLLEALREEGMTSFSQRELDNMIAYDRIKAKEPPEAIITDWAKVFIPGYPYDKVDLVA